MTYPSRSLFWIIVVAAQSFLRDLKNNEKKKSFKSFATAQPRVTFSILSQFPILHFFFLVVDVYDVVAFLMYQSPSIFLRLCTHPS